MGSSWAGTRTRVSCIGRRILNHCATREALWYPFVDVVFFFFNTTGIILCLLCNYFLTEPNTFESFPWHTHRPIFCLTAAEWCPIVIRVYLSTPHWWMLVVSNLGLFFTVPDRVAGNDLIIAYWAPAVCFSSKVWQCRLITAQLYLDTPCQIPLLSGRQPLTSLFILKNGRRRQGSRKLFGSGGNVWCPDCGGYTSV